MFVSVTGHVIEKTTNADAGEQVAILERLGLGEYAGGRLAGESGWIVRHGEGGGPGPSGDVEMTEFEPREYHAGERGGEFFPLVVLCWAQGTLGLGPGMAGTEKWGEGSFLQYSEHVWV